MLIFHVSWSSSSPRVHSYPEVSGTGFHGNPFFVLGNFDDSTSGKMTPPVPFDTLAELVTSPGISVSWTYTPPAGVVYLYVMTTFDASVGCGWMLSVTPRNAFVRCLLVGIDRGLDGGGVGKSSIKESSDKTSHHVPVRTPLTILNITLFVNGSLLVVELIGHQYSSFEVSHYFSGAMSQTSSHDHLPSSASPSYSSDSSELSSSWLIDASLSNMKDVAVGCCSKKDVSSPGASPCDTLAFSTASTGIEMRNSLVGVNGYLLFGSLKSSSPVHVGQRSGAQLCGDGERTCAWWLFPAGLGHEARYELGTASLGHNVVAST